MVVDFPQDVPQLATIQSQLTTWGIGIILKSAGEGYTYIYGNAPDRAADKS
jgi:hypothetical protein